MAANTGHSLWLGLDFGSRPRAVKCIRVKQCPLFAAQEAVLETLVDGVEWRQVFSWRYFFDGLADAAGGGPPDRGHGVSEESARRELQTQSTTTTSTTTIIPTDSAIYPAPLFVNFDVMQTSSSGIVMQTEDFYLNYNSPITGAVLSML